MKIEEGKFYRTRAGRRVGPMVACPNNMKWAAWETPDLYYDAEGVPRGFEEDTIIAEWTDGPVRAVTRKEIVPGTYGRVQVSHTYDRLGEEIFDPQAVINLTARDGSLMDRGNFSAAELRAAASTLTAIADALEETK